MGRSKTSTIVLVVAIAVVVFSVSVAFASYLSMGVKNLASGFSSVSSCDTNGMVVGVDVPMNFPTKPAPGFNVVQLKFSNVNAGCDGLKYKAVLFDNTNDCTAEGVGVFNVVSSSADIMLSSTGCNINFNTGLSLTVYE